ncbi:MAG TPA: L-fucose:H+ symporter permease [Acidobacteriaceae bacterium]|nr:L-fucose:H+ symporter permease [Acidobacteriaceae bacterium]
MLAPPPAGAKEQSSSSQPLIPRGMGLPFFLVTALFFLWGVPNNLNDVLIRQFMTSFAISRFQAGLVQSAFYLGYFLLATPAALLMRRYGYKLGFLVGLLLFSAGAFLFWPAALAGRYAFFLAALFVIASGLSFLETASNPFIAQIGDPGSAARRLNFSQAFNPLGAISGVLVGTVFIFSGVELTPAQISAMRAAGTLAAYQRHETMRVVTPYLVIGCITLFWALLIARTRFPVIARETEGKDENHGSFRELLRYPHFLFAIVAQFVYVGAQVGTWSYFIQYVQDTTHQPEKVAGYFLTGTLVAFGAGRFASAALMRYIRPAVLMGLYSLLNIALVGIGVLFPGWIGLWSIFLTSFFMSVMYPTIFALGIDGLGRNTKIGGSLIVMSIVGGGVLTPLMGLVSQSTHSIAVAYLVPLSCYCVVALYSFLGDRLHRGQTLSAAEAA